MLVCSSLVGCSRAVPAAHESAMKKSLQTEKILKVSRVVLQLSNADKFVAERLSCVPTLPNRKACR